MLKGELYSILSTYFVHIIILLRNDKLSKMRIILLLITLFSGNQIIGQQIQLDPVNLVANKVYMSTGMLDGKSIVRVVKDSTIKEADEPTFVRIKNIDFADGIIEVKVLSRLLPTAAPTDRGFIGLAFRIAFSKIFNGSSFVFCLIISKASYTIFLAIVFLPDFKIREISKLTK